MNPTIAVILSKNGGDYAEAVAYCQRVIDEYRTIQARLTLKQAEEQEKAMAAHV